MDDPIVAEIRKTRDEHARRFGYDLPAICKNIREHQKHCAHRVVHLRPTKTAPNQQTHVTS